MMPRRRYEPASPPIEQPVASLDGPSRTITVEPVVLPVPIPAPRTAPEPEREPSKRDPARRAPKRPREPAR